MNISKKLIASLFDDDALLENDAICLDIILTFIQMRKIWNDLDLCLYKSTWKGEFQYQSF